MESVRICYVPSMRNLSKDRIRELSEPGRYSDGDGLILQISPRGGKCWLLRVQANGRCRDIGLGRVDDLPITMARAKAAEMRQLARSGIDLLEERNTVVAAVPIFEEAA